MNPHGFPPEPKSGASANFAISAKIIFMMKSGNLIVKLFLKKILDNSASPVLKGMVHCPRDGMVDITDLKSVVHCERGGSSPPAGTTVQHWNSLINPSFTSDFQYFTFNFCRFLGEDSSHVNKTVLISRICNVGDCERCLCKSFVLIHACTNSSLEKS